jgi:branched-subunit amino acid ABC-type transport system permease component
MLLWLVAAGLTLIFGVLGVVNFAHGSFYMLGAYVTFWVMTSVANNFWLALIIAPLVVGAIGGVVERFFLKPIYRLATEYQILLTYAFVLIFADLAKILWGAMYVVPPTPWGFEGAISILGRGFPIFNLFVVIVGPLVFAAIWLFINKTKYGTLIRAASSDREMASAIGINAPRLFTAVFMLGTALAALGGGLALPIESVSIGMGDLIIVQCFIVAVIGGLGSLKGAFVGAIIIGLLSSFGILFIPVWEAAISFVLMALVLALRPWGMFGEG